MMKTRFALVDNLCDECLILKGLDMTNKEKFMQSEPTAYHKN